MNEERSAGRPSVEEMLYRVDCQIQMAESVIDEKVDKDLMLIMVRSLKIWKAIRTLIENSEPNRCIDCGALGIPVTVSFETKPDTEELIDTLTAWYKWFDTDRDGQWEPSQDNTSTYNQICTQLQSHKGEREVNDVEEVT
jgi:hypothetical protein